MDDRELEVRLEGIEIPITVQQRVTAANAERGDQAIDPMTWGKTLTLLGAMRRTGWVVLHTQFATANATRFVAWLRRRLLPRLRRGDVLVLGSTQVIRGIRRTATPGAPAPRDRAR